MENSATLDHPLLRAPSYFHKWPAWAAWAAPVKRPLDLRRYLKPADVTRPDTWTSFPAAAAHISRLATAAPPSLPLSAGVGLLVAPPLVFVDFDDLTPDPSSTPPAWASEFLQRASDIGAFTEHSASGTGAHAFIRTSPSFPALTRNRYTRDGNPTPVGVEVYTSARFAAVTGFPYYPSSRPELNDPQEGDALLSVFLQDMGIRGAPVLSAPVLGPIQVPSPSQKVLNIAAELAAFPPLARAFEDPQAAFAAWAADRVKRSLDDSLSAWRFHLYAVAARQSPLSPQPLYELFCPSTTPQHTGIPEWQTLAGYLAKPHRRYSDIQRAHALVQEEQRLLALDLGEPPPPAPSRTQAPRIQPNADLAQSWAQLGLAMKVTRNSAVPVAGTVNFIRCIQKHSAFQQYRIERNTLDGTARVNRQPLPDTLATRFLEPLRAILDMPGDPAISAVRDSIEVVADDAPYDPLQEYLRALPKWTTSDQPLLSHWLERVGAAPDPDLERYSRRIIIGLVARALAPGVKFDYVPVFEGPTGVGKSTLVELLVTRPYWAVMSTDLQSKDAKIALRGKWGLEMAEMSAFKKSDEEARKAFFSTASDSFRPPYGRANIDVPRRCVLIGTTEDKQYLTDHRGNRRYWPIYFPQELDLKWFESRRDALFAEALRAYEDGERFHDNREEMTAPERVQALNDRLATPAWHSRILEHVRALPAPSIPTDDAPGFSGILTAAYVANLQRTLDLPAAVHHMSDAQLVSFLRRCGYHSLPLPYRGPEGNSKKLYAWAHPAFLRLTPEQTRAFLSFFPDLFPERGVPVPWIGHRAEHLAPALRRLGRSE